MDFFNIFFRRLTVAGIVILINFFLLYLVVLVFMFRDRIFTTTKSDIGGFLLSNKNVIQVRDLIYGILAISLLLYIVVQVIVFASTYLDNLLVIS